jgi:putative FmdB family regulatory protein
MPIYEYRCLDCDHEFELIQKFSDPPAENCPACSGAVHKLISRSAFHLKGNGWYATDYARKGSQNGKSSKESSPGGSDTDSSPSSSAKDASKATKDTAKAATAEAVVAA